MSAVLHAPTGATANTVSELPSKIEQQICTQLLSKSGAQIAEALKCDEPAASRIKSGQLSMNWNRWIRLLRWLGWKIVSTRMQCVSDHEMRTLQEAYAFLGSSPELRARFIAWREAQPLDQDWDKQQ